MISFANSMILRFFLKFVYEEEKRTLMQIGALVFKEYVISHK